MRALLLAAALVALVALPGLQASHTLGIWPCLEVATYWYGLGALVGVGNSFLSFTYAPPADALSLTFGSSHLGPFWSAGFTFANITTPDPLIVSPFIGIGWFFNANLCAFLRVTYDANFALPGLLVVLRF